MIYFDYSATTPINKKVLDRFNYICEEYYGNANSTHSYGINCNKIVDEAVCNISSFLNVKKDEIIFTSGSSESNNTIIKGICDKYEGGHIITSSLEHASVLSPISYLQSKGFKVSFAPLNKDGKVDIDGLEKLITEDTVLVSIGAVNSETGIRNNVEEIGKMLKKYPNVVFHSDMTQVLGKDKFDLTNIDAASFSCHKIYGFVGIGLLIVKENVKFTPLIHGGKSVTSFRSGTPQTALIDSVSTCFNEILPNLDETITYVRLLNTKIRTHLSKYEDIVINSKEDSIVHILNISIPKFSASFLQEYFDNKGMLISTQTACASSNDYSKTILALTNDLSLASSSVRISLSYRTTMEEVGVLLDVIDELMEKK